MFRTAIRLAAVALVAFTTVAEAQTRPVFGVAAGITAPQGDLGDFVDNGYHVGVAVGFKVPVLPVALRGDLAYTTFGAKDLDGSLNTLNLSVNAVHAFPGVAIRPYVIGGLGMYRTSGSDDLDSGETVTDMGLNGGAGIQFKLAGMQSFVEARYTHIMSEDDATKVIPISFGIMF